MRSIKNFFINNKLRSLIFFLLLILPNFWFSRDLYLIGEDDTGLSYYEPAGSVRVYSSSWLSNDTLGRLAFPGGELIFSALLYLFRFLSFGKINIQLFVFGFILSFSFNFIYKILVLLTKEEKPYSYCLAALFYVLSPYFVTVEYFNLMPSAYLVLLIPVLTYYSLKSLETGSSKPIYIASIWSFILSRSITTPAFINSFLLLFLFLLFYPYYTGGLRKTRSAFMVYFKLSLLMIIVNSHIFIPLFSSYKDNSINTTVADRKSNTESLLMNLESEFNTNKLQYYLSNFYPEGISRIQGWRNHDIYQKYYNKSYRIMYAFPLISFLGIFIIPKNKRKLFLPITFFFILTLSLVTIDFAGVKSVYLYLMQRFPIFTMNRYPSMKFHVPFILSYSLLFGMSLNYLIGKIGGSKRKLVYSLCTVSLLMATLPFINGDIYTKKLKPLDSQRSMDFNLDYKNLVSNFNKYVEDDSKLLLFPMGYGYGSFISGENSSQFYRSTITGFKYFTGYSMYGCLESLRAYPGNRIFDKFHDYYFEGDLDSFFSGVKDLGIKYIVYTKDTNSLKKYKSEVIPKYTYNSKGYYDVIGKDNPVFENNNYSVYKVKNYNEVSTITSEDERTEIYFKKVSDFMYLLKVKTAGPDKILLHEGFSKYWNVFKIEEDILSCGSYKNYATSYPKIYECDHINDNLKGSSMLLNMLSLKSRALYHEETEDYLNSWEIDTKGEYEYIAIIMNNQKFYILGILVSLLAVITLILLLLKPHIKKDRCSYF